MSAKRAFLTVIFLLGISIALLWCGHGIDRMPLFSMAHSSSQAFLPSWVTSAPPVPLEHVPAIVRSLRPNYPYSIVPGGVYSREELQRWMVRDEVVREHYRSFNASAVRVIAAGETFDAHVSYRKNGAVFWTKRKLHIPRGELLITDGVYMARARCGNRLALSAPPGTIDSYTEPEGLSVSSLNPTPRGNGNGSLLPAPDLAEPGAASTGVGSLTDLLQAPPFEAESSAARSFAFISAPPLARAGLTSSSSSSGKGSVPVTTGMPAPLAAVAVPEPRSVGIAGLILLLIGLALRRATRSRSRTR